ncbi:hypothetical protein [Azonexus sp.]|uniref:hypothetical protein n=1 Tax=Azonexus sp. TaxID=1872668 RepID=UPI0027B9AB0C|nr:hypothetical protein [Azonexus sp.]
MIIQGYNNIAAVYGKSQKPASERQNMPTAMANLADRVSISDAARALSESQRTVTQTRTPVQEEVLRAASSDRASAEKIAYQMTAAPSQICYSSIYDMGPDGKLNKLASSGRMIDQNFRDRFGQEASIVDAQIKAMYDSEKAKGTDPVQIIGMMFDHINSQSSDYLEATGWGWSDGVRVIG